MAGLWVKSVVNLTAKLEIAGSIDLYLGVSLLLYICMFISRLVLLTRALLGLTLNIAVRKL